MMMSVLGLASIGDPGEGGHALCSSQRSSSSTAVSSLQFGRSRGTTLARGQPGPSSERPRPSDAPSSTLESSRPANLGAARGSSALLARRLDVAHLKPPLAADDSPPTLSWEGAKARSPLPQEDFSSTECVVNFGEPLRCRPVLFQELLQQPALHRKSTTTTTATTPASPTRASMLAPASGPVPGPGLVLEPRQQQQHHQQRSEQTPASPVAAASALSPTSHPFHLSPPFLRHRRRTSSEVSPLSSTAAVIDSIPPSMSSEEVHRTVAGLWHDSLELPHRLGGVMMDSESSDEGEEAREQQTQTRCLSPVPARTLRTVQGVHDRTGDLSRRAVNIASRENNHDDHGSQPLANSSSASAAAEKNSEQHAEGSPSAERRHLFDRRRNSSMTTTLIDGTGSNSGNSSSGNSNRNSNNFNNNNNNNNNHNNINSINSDNNNLYSNTSRCSNRRDQAWTEDTLATMPSAGEPDGDGEDAAEGEGGEEGEEEGHEEERERGGEQGATAAAAGTRRMSRNRSVGSSGSGSRVAASSSCSLSRTPSSSSTPSLPCLPLPRSETFKYGTEKEVEVVKHRSKAPHIEAIALFLPGVNGGIGPCRSSGNYSDESALFPVVAEELSRSHPIDCYRLSWSQRNPKMDEAVHAVTRTLLYALTVAKVSSTHQRPLKVFMIGHSFGSAVAMQTGLRLQTLIPSSKAELGGIALLAPQWVGCADAITKVEAAKLIVHGMNDEQLGYGVSLALHNKATAPATLKLVRRCDHNFTGHKTRLIKIVMRWVLQVSKVDG